MNERRLGYRLPLDLYLNEHTDDRLRRCVASNVSESGLYMHKIVHSARPSGIVQLEFELPGTGETVWARGEVTHDHFDAYFHGTGVRLTGIARKHTRLLREYVEHTRRQRLEGLLCLVRENRYDSISIGRICSPRVV